MPSVDVKWNHFFLTSLQMHHSKLLKRKWRHQKILRWVLELQHLKTTLKWQFLTFVVCATVCNRAHHRPIASQVGVYPLAKKKQVISSRSSKSFPTSTFPLDWTRLQTGEKFYSKSFFLDSFCWTNRIGRKRQLNTCEHWISKVAVLTLLSVHRCWQHCFCGVYLCRGSSYKNLRFRNSH